MALCCCGVSRPFAKQGHHTAHGRTPLEHMRAQTRQVEVCKTSMRRFESHAHLALTRLPARRRMAADR